MTDNNFTGEDIEELDRIPMTLSYGSHIYLDYVIAALEAISAGVPLGSVDRDNLTEKTYDAPAMVEAWNEFSDKIEAIIDRADEV